MKNKLSTYRKQNLLCKFFINVRKTNGDESSSLSSFQRSLQRYLTENNIQTNILKDIEFEKSRQVLAAKRKNLVKQGKGCKPQATRALTDDEENTLFITGQFGDSSPSALQRTMWWFLSMHFGFVPETKVESYAGATLNYKTTQKTIVTRTALWQERLDLVTQLTTLV